MAIIGASAPFGITDAHVPDRHFIALDAARTEVFISRRLSSRQRLRLDIQMDHRPSARRFSCALCNVNLLPADPETWPLFNIGEIR